MPGKPNFRAKYLRQLPSVGKLLEHPVLTELLQICPRILLTEAINEIIDIRKGRILDAEDESQLMDINLATDSFVKEAAALTAEKSRMGVRRAINATGDVLISSLGKAPLNDAAKRALLDVSSGYVTLTLDDRDAHIQKLLAYLTGAEAALVVNNNAAAIMLILNTIADGKEVVVSRGQLMENDGFRISDAIFRSGAKLVSVGATNKSRLRDYSDTVSENTGAILRVHKSNYRIAGFSQDVSLRDLVAIGEKHDVPVVDDIGGGCLVDLTQYGLPEQPPAFLSIRDGADIVCFSGDELLSAPQSGIVIGSEKYISLMKKNPIYRMLRVDKLILAALEATLRSYLDTEKILETNPALRFLSRSLDEIESMSHSLMNSLVKNLSDQAVIELEDGYSKISSISADPEKFPTKLISIKPIMLSSSELDKKLRSLPTPIFTIICGDRLLLDLRSVRSDEMEEITSTLVELNSSG